MTLKIKVGKKGYVILLKAVREAVGIEEEDELIVEIKDCILLKPIRKVDIEKLREALKKHVELIKIFKIGENLSRAGLQEFI